MTHSYSSSVVGGIYGLYCFFSSLFHDKGGGGVRQMLTLADNWARCRARFRAGAFTVAPVSASSQPRGHGLRQQSLRP